MSTKKRQVNIFIEPSWKAKLEKIARKKSYEEDRNISMLDLIKETINEVHHLDEE